MGNFRFFVSDKLPKIGEKKQLTIAKDNVPYSDHCELSFCINSCIVRKDLFRSSSEQND
jgi:hypothetical protein